jgi:hypothetical protein
LGGRLFGKPRCKKKRWAPHRARKPATSIHDAVRCHLIMLTADRWIAGKSAQTFDFFAKKFKTTADGDIEDIENTTTTAERAGSVTDEAGE